MKGHMKIELFDAKTGKREEVHEDDNLVTNAVKYLLSYVNRLNRAPSNDVFPIATNSLGGVMLFDETLEEDVENVEFPSDAHLIGYSDRTLNTDNPQRGSFNSLESGDRDDGYTAVWDFGTSQANGTIKAVCLTSNYAGANPYLRMFSGDVYSLMGYRNDPLNPDNYAPLRQEGEYLYFLNIADGNVYRSKFNPFKIQSVHDQMGFSNNIVLEQVADMTQLPTLYDIDLSKRNDFWLDGDDGYFYIVGFHWNTYNNNQRFNYSTGNVISVRKVKYSDDSWEIGEEQVITIANADLHNCGGGWYRMSQGYLYWVSRDNTSIYIINMSNTADVRKIEVAGANESQIRINDALRSSIKGDGVAFGYTFRVPDDTTDYVRWGIIHHDGLMTKSAATGGQTYDVWDKQPVYKILGVSSARRWSYPYYYRSDITLMAAYLGTINNLSSPIVKTASQTMKVTYTLTDLEEDDDE